MAARLKGTQSAAADVRVNIYNGGAAGRLRTGDSQLAAE